MFKGSLVALVTPMQANGDIDWPSFDRLIGWHLDNGSDGLVVLGTTGESATVNPEERAGLIQRSLAVVAGQVPVIVGAGSNATSHTIDLTRQAMELGADAVLLVTPYYNKPTQEGLFQHFKTVADAVSIPQILYNVPGRTGCDLLPETVGRLAQVDNIVALKEATGDIDRLRDILAQELSLALLSGDDFTAVDFMLAGGQGVISVAANVVPKAFYDLCQAALSGQVASAREQDKRLQPLYEQLFTESNPIPTKWALSEMGLIPGGLRLPLTPLSIECHDPLRHVLRTLSS